MYCPNCKQGFNSKFCPDCGTKLIEKTQRVCPNCNIEVESKFCPECGTKIVEMPKPVTPTCSTETADCKNEEAESLYQAAQEYYYGSNGKEENFKEAVKLYSKAAAMGHAEAEYQMGFFYDCGIGIQSDKVEAPKWYSKAAEQGYADAIEELKKLE